MASGNPIAKFTNRLTVVILILQAISIIGLLGYILYHDGERFSVPVFTVYSPEKILTRNVPLNGKTKVEATKCNLTNEDLTVGGIVYWIREEPTFARIQASDIALEKGTAYKPGCTTYVIEYPVPADATLGTWHLEGTNIVATPYGERQVISWHSDSFMIVPPNP